MLSGNVLMNIVDSQLGEVSIVPENIEEYNINQAIIKFETKRLYWKMNKKIIVVKFDHFGFNSSEFGGIKMSI